ncbi:putative photosynthetic complex assembly protein PuhE [Aquibium sp. A9E412]|uniref:putative photosynthetic complex assembly protein PuhE n=1 Tax=Aquibium sp. A9E412 TaxID=2976767 RepID=UPI0025AF0479|nr:putative photosynthetic complex assembly protein PuhE [Aquibium sp. A9E412]MDN2566054.1 putative photosynthetic complex assembly protein PuhE [Aquibium sp. A9E412]
MAHLAAAVLVAVVVWWVSTGFVFLAARRGAARPRLVLAGFTALALAGLAGLAWTARQESLAGVYLAFLSALAVWAWHEIAFLFGFVTGPRRTPCPPELTGWRRFAAAFATLRDHELAILASAGLVALLVWGAPNQAGLWTFLVLWGMRVSAKLTIFLGAPFSVSGLIPPHLDYLTSYFRTDRTSRAFAAIIALAAVPFGYFCYLAATAEALHLAVAATLIAALAGLAIAEHFFLVLPVPDALSWAWMAPAADERDAAGGHAPLAIGRRVVLKGARATSPHRAALPVDYAKRRGPAPAAPRTGGTSWT